MVFHFQENIIHKSSLDGDIEQGSLESNVTKAKSDIQSGNMVILWW